MKKVILASLIWASCWTGAGTASATELVYEFINPSFIGGLSYNASWLQSQAQMQNKLKESTPSYERDPIAEFEESLNSQILYRLSRQIIDQAFGEDGMSDGDYVVGDFEISIETGVDGLNVTITNPADGSTTVIEVPFY